MFSLSDIPCVIIFLKWSNIALRVSLLHPSSVELAPIYAAFIYRESNNFKRNFSVMKECIICYRSYNSTINTSPRYNDVFCFLFKSDINSLHTEQFIVLGISPNRTNPYKSRSSPSEAFKILYSLNTVSRMSSGDKIIISSKRVFLFFLAMGFFAKFFHKLQKVSLNLFYFVSLDLFSELNFVFCPFQI